MESKKYLKWYQKIGYGMGDMGANFMYTFVASFILIYVTDTVGLNAGIVGTLMMISKIFDGVTDVFFGGLIDRTHTKMGKARPWMFWSTFPLAIFEILLFLIPDASPIIQYGYFFVVYTLINALFYTANNVAFSSLTALVTKNPSERVQLGSIRFIFALVASILISSITVTLSNAFGGGTAGWRMVAIIYALLLVLFNMIAVMSVKEVENADEGKTVKKKEEKHSLISNIRLLISNKYYLLILAYYIVYYSLSGISQGIGIYFCTYTLGNAALLGLLSMAGMIPMIIGLVITPALVSKFGIYKVNVIGMIISTIASVPVMLAGYAGNITLFIVLSIIKGLGSSPMLGTLNAVIADAATYTYNKDGVHLDGTMYSCSSMGMKVGSGVGTAVCGWLLAFAGYDGTAAVQAAGALSMINVMYLVFPMVFSILMLLIVASLNVDKGNQMILEKKAAGSV